jgi:hypothetical protein
MRYTEPFAAFVEHLPASNTVSHLEGFQGVVYASMDHLRVPRAEVEPL